MKRVIALILVFLMMFALSGCGLNQNQEKFINAVSTAEGDEDNRLDLIKAAFVEYSNLSEEDANNKKVNSSLKRLIACFDSEVESTSKETMTIELDARITALEDVAALIPESIQNESTGCELIKTIRENHLKYYIEQLNFLTSNISKIREYFDGSYYAEADALLEEMIPLAEELSTVSSYDEQLKEIIGYGMDSFLPQGIETMEDMRDFIEKANLK